jgi:type IV pilus assembly protein PilY1
VLVGGMRTGGDAYFALDVTDPFLPELLWETSIPEIGSSFTLPALVQTEAGKYLWVGSAPDAGGVASVALINLLDGTPYTVPIGDVHSGLNAAGPASVYDTDWDGLSDFVYHGDLAGTLWRWDVRQPNPEDWQPEVLFSGGQPIQARPTLAVAEDGGLLVYFGTGQYMTSADLGNTDVQSFFCIRDDGVVTDLSASSLANQTSSIGETDTMVGWKLDLVLADGERVTESASVIEGVVYFATFAPSSVACAGGGRSWLYRVDYRDGARPQDGGTDDRVVDLGEGISAKPIIQIEEEQVVVQTSDARISLVDLSIAPRRMMVEGWRERFE